MTDRSRRRRPPPELSPLERGGVRYRESRNAQLLGASQHAGYLIAETADTKHRLWHLQVYSIDYDPRRERDVQDIFFKRLEWAADGKHILVEDELGRRYLIDPDARTVAPIPD
jgi:hypothetical protein